MARILTLENVYGTVVPRIGGVEHTYAKIQDALSLLDNRVTKLEKYAETDHNSGILQEMLTDVASPAADPNNSDIVNYTGVETKQLTLPEASAPMLKDLNKQEHPAPRYDRFVGARPTWMW